MEGGNLEKIKLEKPIFWMSRVTEKSVKGWRMQETRGRYFIGSAEIGNESWQGVNVKEELEQANRWKTRRHRIEFISNAKEVIDEIDNIEENEGEEMMDVLVKGIIRQMTEDGRIQEGMIGSVWPEEKHWESTEE